MLRLRCPHCGHETVEDKVTGPDALEGTFVTEKQAARVAVLSDNTYAFTCEGCGERCWAAFVDRRW